MLGYGHRWWIQVLLFSFSFPSFFRGISFRIYFSYSASTLLTFWCTLAFFLWHAFCYEQYFLWQCFTFYIILPVHIYLSSSVINGVVFFGTTHSFTRKIGNKRCRMTRFFKDLRMYFCYHPWLPKSARNTAGISIFVSIPFQWEELRFPSSERN